MQDNTVNDGGVQPPVTTKPTRKAIPKKLRFEVFKRDSFKCQYCGAVAPDVLLEVDHIRPVADGGTNDITNLITSCNPCNNGKSDRKLSDNATVAKSRNQLELLQQRREQLELMMEWQRGLTALADETTDAVTDFWDELIPEYSMSASGRASIKLTIQKYGAQAVIEAIRTSADAYLKRGEDGKATKESVEKCYAMIGGICRVNLRSKDAPELKELYYLRGIMRKRFNYFDPVRAIKNLEAAHSWGICTGELRDIILNSNSWSSCNAAICEAIDDAQEHYKK